MRKVIIMVFLTLFTFSAHATENKSVTLTDTLNTVSQIPNKLVKWLSDEIVKTKEYQKKAWSDVSLISKGE